MKSCNSPVPIPPGIEEAMSGVTKHRGAFMATKAAVAAGTVFAVQRIAKRNKVAAILTGIAINSAYAMVVRHNYKIARGR